LYLAEGDVDSAIAWAESSGLSIEDELHYSPTEQAPKSSELHYLTYAKVLLAYGQQKASSSHLQNALHLQIQWHRGNRCFRPEDLSAIMQKAGLSHVQFFSFPVRLAHLTNIACIGFRRK
jgi:hypothetical protein